MEGFRRSSNYPGNVKARIMSQIVRVFFRKSSRFAGGSAAIAADPAACALEPARDDCPAIGLRKSGAAIIAAMSCRDDESWCVGPARRGARECEAHHMRLAAPALLLRAAGGGLSRIAAMTTRRMMSWWFRFVLSGRFLDRFLSLPRAH